MKNFLKALVLIPIAIVLVAFAIANRRDIAVSLDPFANGDASALSVTAPLFVLLLLALFIGVLVGGASTWLTQGRHRKAARQARGEVERLRAEASAFRARAGELVAATPPMLPPPGPK